jgi:hypothetical protein
VVNTLHGESNGSIGTLVSTRVSAVQYSCCEFTDMRLRQIAFFLIARSLAFLSLHAETQQAADLQLGHDYWTYKDGARRHSILGTGQ